MERGLVDELRWRLGSAGGDLGFAGQFAEEGLQHDVKDGDEEEVEHGGEDHASNDGCADRVAAVCSCAGGEVERTDAEDEGDGGHQNGAEAEFGGFDGGLCNCSPLLEELLGELTIRIEFLAERPMSITSPI